ncbi:LamG domain-containing protein [Phytomonospora endophytica]|uniref:LamG-like jellyroll fold domain-containing protein n=1 Tax=Phytomonospora endophytica TaxID=714109 RepID=A0A841FKI4_9ACTN|nr:LamG domain-containing protein [Phytomonospora endophytica]MBB6037841.1 hypothetical protein [Phytomonospora endophytica]
MKSPLSLARVAVLPVTAALLLPVAWAMPATAQEVEPPDPDLPAVECPQFDGPPHADDELTAYRYALACNVDVEVTTLRDIDREVFATPDKTLESHIAVAPYQVKDSDGGWIPIDASLVPTGSGSYTSAATVVDITVGAGGDAPFLTATDPGGGALSLSWPGGALPAPVVAGSLATYPEVFPGVDLAVQAEPVGFSWVLVVKTPEAAADPALATVAVDIAATGLTVTENPATGHIEVADATGNLVFEAGQAIMWDSSIAGGGTAPAAATDAVEAPATDPGKIADVEVELTASGIDLIPDPAMLADETAVYPVYIDPPFTSSRKSWANVYQGRSGEGWTGDSSWPRAGGMRVGNNTWWDCGDGCGLWRSVITLNVGKLSGKYVASAAVKVLQTHTAGCGAYGLELWRTEKTGNGVSWNGVKWLYGKQLETQSPPSSNTTGSCGSGNSHEWVAYDGAEVKRRVQSAADQDYDTVSFGFRSSSESDPYQWRRLSTDSVRLEVVYYIYPPKPDQLTIDGTTCQPLAERAPWIPSATPTLQVRARTYESESVYVRLRVRKNGASSNLWYYRTPGAVGTNSPVPRMITPGLTDGSYYWQARADSRHTDAVNSDYTAPCYFKVDGTKPTLPGITVTSPTGSITAGQTVKLAITSTDPVVNGVSSGIRSYQYDLGTGEFDKGDYSDGSSSIAIPNVPAGRSVVNVRFFDRAGNPSDTRQYTFFAGSVISPVPMGAWRLGGDTADDTPHKNDLVPATGSGPVFAEYPAGSGNRALKLDGKTCLTGPAPVDTDGALTVSLRVRMDAKPAEHAKVLTQGGPDHSAYQVQYATATNTWSFSMLSESYEWYSVTAANPAALGTWLHIIGTYDPDAGITRMYFNGLLAAERTVDFVPWNGRSTFGVGCLRGAGGSTGHFLTGALDDVSVHAGLLSAADIKAMKAMPSGEVGRWEMRGNGADATRFGRGLTLPASSLTAFDPFGRPHGALVLDGQSCATGPAFVPGDDTFGISAWVRPTVLEGGTRVFLGQADAAGDGFVVGLNPDGEWFFGSARGLLTGVTADRDEPVIAPMSSGDYIPPDGGWQNVALQYYGSGNWTLHIDGRFYDPKGHSGGELTGVPGVVGGGLTIGCADFGSGARNRFTGLVHDVRVWRGLKDLSDVAEMFADQPAELEGRWRLEGKDASIGNDNSGKDHHFLREGTTSFTDGYNCADSDSAMEMFGTGSAATSGPVIATDESFTVTAWVRLDTLDTSATYVSAAGHHNTGFRLQYDAVNKRFQFVMTSADAPSSATGFTWSIARGTAQPQVGYWYHLAGVFDLHAGKMHLYVSGDKAASTDGPASPWRAEGPLVLGATATIGGGRTNRLDGAIDDVLVWQGVVPDHIFGQIAAAPVRAC